jgi:hypothetical protein
MVGAVSSTTTAWAGFSPTSSAAPADKILATLLQSPDLLQSMAGRTFANFPPSGKMVLSTLWGLLDVSGGSHLSKSDVETAVKAVGGHAAEASALWAQLSPDNSNEITAGDFASNAYLNNAIPNMLTAVRASVDDTRQEQALKTIKSNSILDFIVPNGGNGSTVLDLFV